MVSTNRQRGFTLIEVMVALVILALAMTAVSRGLGQFAQAAYFMETKTLASWVASNKIVEFSLAPAWPKVGDQEGEVEFANQNWRWEAVVEATQVENLRRIEVTVTLADDPKRELHKLAGLLEPPAPPGIGGAVWQVFPEPEGDRQ